MTSSEYELRIVTAGVLAEYLPDYSELVAGPLLSDIGAVTFGYNTSGVNYSILNAEECEVAITRNGVEMEDGRFLMQDDDGDEVEENSRTRTFVGRTAVYTWLSDALIYSPDGSLTLASETVFSAATPGNIITTLLSRAQTRGTSTLITYPTFNSTTDSNGVAWAKTLNISYKVGLNLLQVVQDLVEKGVVELKTVGRELRAYNAGGIGTDRTVQANPVVLQRGRDIKESPKKRSSKEVTNVVLVEGDEGVLTQRTDATSLAARRRRESYMSQGGVVDTGTLAIIGDTTLSLYSDPRVQKTVGLTFTNESPRPWGDYYNGDYIWCDTGSGLERYRLRQIALTQTSSDDLPEIAIVLNDAIQEREIQLARQISGITGGSISNAAPGTTSPPVDDTTVPKAPTSVTINTAAYVATDGTTQAQIGVSWGAVTQNFDNSAITDLGGYEVQIARTSGQWQPLGRTDASTTAAYLSALPPGVAVDARVRAYDTNNHASAWSSTASTTTAVDAANPPTPSTPTIDSTTYMGALRIKWDGKDSGGAAMPLDFASLEVHASLVNNFTPDTTTRIDEYTTPYGGITTFAASNTGPTYVKFIAVDRSNKRSITPSAQASATASQVLTNDVANGIISAIKTNLAAINNSTGGLNNDVVGTLQLANNAVSAAKTSLAAISSSSGSLNIDTVGANQILSNAVTAIKIQAGAVTTEKLTVGSLSEGLLLNSSFEDAAAIPSTGNPAAQWTGSGLGSRSTADSSSGTASLLTGAHGNPAAQAAYTIPAKPGDVFVLTARAKQQAATTGLYFRLSYRDAAGAQITTSDGVGNIFANIGVPAAWTTYTGQFAAAPATTVGVLFQIYNVSGNVYVDGIDLRKVVISAQIGDGAVVATKMAADSITATNAAIASGTIITAQIQNAQITDAKVVDMTVQKLTAGNLIVDMTLTAGKIKTGASSGARVEMDAAGLRAYATDGVTKTVEILSSSGAATFMGGFSNGASGNRVVIDKVVAGPGVLGTIQFHTAHPSATSPAYILSSYLGAGAATDAAYLYLLGPAVSSGPQSTIGLYSNNSLTSIEFDAGSYSFGFGNVTMDGALIVDDGITLNQGRAIFINDTTGVDFGNSQIEARSGGSGKIAHIAFHIPGIIANKIGSDNSGLRTFAQTDTSFADFRVNQLVAASTITGPYAEINSSTPRLGLKSQRGVDTGVASSEYASNGVDFYQHYGLYYAGGIYSYNRYDRDSYFGNNMIFDVGKSDNTRVTALRLAPGAATVYGLINGTTDVQVNSATLPRGYIGSVVNNTSTGGIVGSEVTLCSGNFNLIANRRYRVTATARAISSTVGGDAFSFRIKIGGSYAVDQQVSSGPTAGLGVNGVTTVGYIFSGSTSSQTIAFVVTRTAGSGTGTVGSNLATNGMTMYVEDIGA